MQQMLFVSDKQKEKQQSLNIKIMATTTVNFQQDGSDYISDIIIAQSNTLAFRIKVDQEVHRKPRVATLPRIFHPLN